MNKILPIILVVVFSSNVFSDNENIVGKELVCTANYKSDSSYNGIEEFNYVAEKIGFKFSKGYEHVRVFTTANNTATLPYEAVLSEIYIGTEESCLDGGLMYCFGFKIDRMNLGLYARNYLDPETKHIPNHLFYSNKLELAKCEIVTDMNSQIREQIKENQEKFNEDIQNIKNKRKL